MTSHFTSSKLGIWCKELSSQWWILIKTMKFQQIYLILYQYRILFDNLFHNDRDFFTVNNIHHQGCDDLGVFWSPHIFQNNISVGLFHPGSGPVRTFFLSLLEVVNQLNILILFTVRTFTLLVGIFSLFVVVYFLILS